MSRTSTFIHHAGRRGPPRPVGGLRRLGRFGRRGLASVLAMLYLVLFASLAVGFYAASTMAAQIARNERNIQDASMAADAGMQFIRYQLGIMDIPTSTPANAIVTAVLTQLGAQLNGTANMNGDTVVLNGSTIQIPGNTTHYINLDAAGNQRFRCDITQSGTQLIVKVTGRCADPNVARAIQVNYTTAPRASAIFNYGVASKSAISMQGNVKITGATDPTKGSVLSATAANVPLTMTGSPSISGDFSYSNPTGSPSYGGGTIAGYGQANANFASHVHGGVTPPQFPDIDTSMYLPYALNTYTASMGKSLTNVLLPPGSYSFAGGTTIQGVLYIQTPATVSFKGNTTIQGVIVVENNPKGSPSTNTITFGGNVSASGIQTLPANATFPAGERALTGAFLLAPNFAVSFQGDFGTVGGSIVASQFTFSGNAGGTVNGTVINLADTALNMAGNSDIIIASTGTTNYPTGVNFGNKYVPLPDTYLEVLP